MKYAVEMGSGAVIDIPSFIKIGSGIQKFDSGDTRTPRQEGDRISLVKESRLKSCRSCSWCEVPTTLALQVPPFNSHRM
jgi:hypothetical protein